jgi:hypothetical protein
MQVELMSSGSYEVELMRGEALELKGSAQNEQVELTLTSLTLR